MDMQSTPQLSQRYLHISRLWPLNAKSRYVLHMLLTYRRHTGLQDNCIWLGQVFSKRHHSKCAHTILYHSFRLRWSLLVGKSYVGLSTTSVLNYWTKCSQNHWLLANPTYTGYQPFWYILPSCIQKGLYAWVGPSSPSWQGLLCREPNKIMVLKLHLSFPQNDEMKKEDTR